MSQKYLAGAPRFERGITVLETVVIPFHYTPIMYSLLRTSGSRTSMPIFSNWHDGAGRELWSTVNLRTYLHISCLKLYFCSLTNASKNPYTSLRNILKNMYGPLCGCATVRCQSQKNALRYREHVLIRLTLFMTYSAFRDICCCLSLAPHSLWRSGVRFRLRT